jgi:REP element-mobilizing transposase RayT
MPDHVHCVLSCPSTVTIATVARQLKGVSSALANSLRGERGCFRWQTGYGAFTIGRTQVPATVAYVRGQCQHHAVSSLHADWEPDAAVVGTH